jgi:hypothetical protein
MLLGSSLHHFPDGAARVDKVMSVSPFYFCISMLVLIFIIYSFFINFFYKKFIYFQF